MKRFVVLVMSIMFVGCSTMQNPFESSWGFDKVKDKYGIGRVNARHNIAKSSKAKGSLYCSYDTSNQWYDAFMAEAEPYISKTKKIKTTKNEVITEYNYWNVNVRAMFTPQRDKWIESGKCN